MTTATDLTEVTVNLVPSAVTALADAAVLSGHTRTDTVNRAVHVYAEVCYAAALHGGRFTVDHNGDTIEITVRPARRRWSPVAVSLVLIGLSILWVVAVLVVT